jgi:hypothetical protein
MYSAVTEIAKTALMAWGPAKTSSPTTREKNASKTTVLTGVPVVLDILYSQPERGNAPSREKAYVCGKWVSRRTSVPKRYF